jgi:hypothetical protein
MSSLPGLAMIPGTIVCSTTRCTAPKELALFVVLHWWRITGSWELVGADLSCQHG